jgi:hypothetical protein
VLPKLGAGVDGFPKAGAGAVNPMEDDAGLPNGGAVLPNMGCDVDGAAPKRGDDTGAEAAVEVNGLGAAAVEVKGLGAVAAGVNGLGAVAAEVNGLGATGGFWIENGEDPDPV